GVQTCALPSSALEPGVLGRDGRRGLLVEVLALLRGGAGEEVLDRGDREPLLDLGVDRPARAGHLGADGARRVLHRGVARDLPGGARDLLVAGPAGLGPEDVADRDR